MRIAEAAAASSLKLTKRMLVPLHARFTEQFAKNMRAAIATIVPFTAQVQVVSTLVYLGLVMGPAADESS
eukprot:8256817-Pyramimonas_sp.AAC.1